MILVENVSKRWQRRGRRSALQDVSLQVPAGSVCAIVGPNGAGKSTLLSLLLGFTRPSSGRITIGDDAPRDYVRDHGAGYLPERFSLPPALTVADALQRLARLDGNGADPHAALQRFGLQQHAGQRVQNLSRGLLQRVGLAQALLARRELVVLDEPTEGLDPVWRVRLRDTISELRAAGSTVIIASHDLAEVERAADHAVLIENGSVRETLDLRDAGAGTQHVITLQSPTDAMRQAFSNAEPLGDGRWSVHVQDAAELSQRLAALLAMGGVIAAVEPQRRTLEQRVQDALEGDA